MIRRILFVTGVAAGVLGLVLVVSPGLAGDITVSDILVYLLGVLALLLSVSRLQHRRKAERRATTTPDPETPVSLPSPGDEVNKGIRNLSRRAQRGRLQTEPLDLDVRLEELAVRVLSRTEDITREEAGVLLTEGTWTEDRKAAAFFSESVSLPFTERVRESLRMRSRKEVCAIHAIEELAEQSLGREDND